MSSPRQSDYIPPPPPRRRRHRYLLLLLLVLWMGAIFAGSTQLMSGDHTHAWVDPIVARLFPHMSYDHRMEVHLFIRKCGHVTEYAILTLLAAYFCLGSAHARLRRYWWIWSLMFVAAFAAGDEFHQSLVPGRDAELTDVALDTAANATAAAIWLVLRRREQRRKRLAAEGI